MNTKVLRGVEVRPCTHMWILVMNGNNSYQLRELLTEHWQRTWLHQWCRCWSVLLYPQSKLSQWEAVHQHWTLTLKMIKPLQCLQVWLMNYNSTQHWTQSTNTEHYGAYRCWGVLLYPCSIFCHRPRCREHRWRASQYATGRKWEPNITKELIQTKAMRKQDHHRSRYIAGCGRNQ